MKTKDFNISADGLFKNGKEYRNVAIYLLNRHTAMTNRRVGELFGDLSYSAVAKAQQRFSAKLDKDRSVRKIINKITAKMSHVKT